MCSGRCSRNCVSSDQQMDEGRAWICRQYYNTFTGSILRDMGTSGGTWDSLSFIWHGSYLLLCTKALVEKEDNAVPPISGSSISDGVGREGGQVSEARQTQKNRWPGRNYKGSMTVETAYLMPLFFLMFILIMRMTFYFHDKTILYGAAYETASVGVEAARGNLSENVSLEDYFRQRMGRKMIYFGRAKESITVGEEEIVVEAYASRKRMAITVHVKMPVTKPERQIRIIQSVKNALNNKGGE